MRKLIFIWCLLGVVHNTSLGQTSPDEVYTALTSNTARGQDAANLPIIDSLYSVNFFADLPCYIKGKIYHRISNTYYRLGSLEKAVAYYRDTTLGVWETCPEATTIDKANSIFNLAASYKGLFRYAEAEQNFLTSLRLFRSSPEYSDYNLGRKSFEIGSFYKEVKDFNKAETYFRNALELFPDVPKSDKYKLRIYNELGIIFNETKEYEKAENILADAYDYSELLDSDVDFESKINITINRASALINLDNLEKANALFLSLEEKLKQENFQFLSESTQAKLRSVMYELKGLLLLKEGQVNEAESMIKRGLSLRIEKQRPDLISISYENLASVEDKRGDNDLSIAYIDTAMSYTHDPSRQDIEGNPILNNVIVYDYFTIARQLMIKASYMEAANQPNRLVFNVYDKADTVMTQMLMDLRNEASKLYVAGNIIDNYSEAISYSYKEYAQTGSENILNRLFYYSSKTKAISLLSDISEKNAIEKYADEETKKTIQVYEDEMNEIFPRLRDVSSSQDSLMARYLDTQAKLDELISSIKKMNKDFSTEQSSYLTPMTIQEIREELPDSGIYIEFFEGKEAFYKFIITADTAYCVAIPGVAGINQEIADFKKWVADPTSAIESIKSTGRKLSDFLFSDIHGMDNYTTLLIVPDGSLYDLPFDVLSDPSGKLFVRKYKISTAYTSQLFFHNNDEINGRYLGIGTTYDDGLEVSFSATGGVGSNIKLSPLPLSEKEIGEIHEMIGGQVFLNEHASSDALRLHADRADIIHLSLHGLVSRDYPELSSIIFDDRTEDNMLKLSEIHSIGLENDLTILSACHTATGKVYKGEGVQGLTKAFMKSGKTTVISSIWSASELSSRNIIHSMFGNMVAGMKIDEALQKAKTEYIDNAPPSQQHPYYWAHLIPIGKTDRVYVKHTSPWKKYGFIALGGILLIAGLYTIRQRKAA